VPFIRHLRDRRGYETTVVMHGYRPVQGPPKSRVLYLFRSPSHIKIGREALDEEAREALEHTHPDLSFDWIALGRERDAMRAHQMRDRDADRERHRPSPGRSQQPGERPRQPVKVVIEDHSTLGKTVGAERAATLRTQYAELVQRIQRRSRTPEERDRLLDSAHRLNPDDWIDAAAIPGLSASFEADRQAMLAEIPGRRRGRRGGRRGDRPGGPDGGAAGEQSSAAGDEGAEAEDEAGDAGDVDEVDPSARFDEAADASAIMAIASERPEVEGEEAIDARTEHSGGSPSDADPDDRRLDGGVGSGSAAETAGDDLPVDDEFRRH
jgi:hypothetical protein